MTSSLVIPLIMFTAAVSLVLIENFILFAIIGEVNRKLPENEQIGYLFWYPGKFGRIKRRYHEFYPNGRLLSAFYACVIVSIILLLATAWKLGFFRFS